MIPERANVVRSSQAVGMDNAEPRETIMNILDRAAFTAGPFWEATPDDRAQVADLIGLPEREATVEVAPDGLLWSGER